jgi:CubicO group peptidase (beta-lactamase class C family)
MVGSFPKSIHGLMKFTALPAWRAGGRNAILPPMNPPVRSRRKPLIAAGRKQAARLALIATALLGSACAGPKLARDLNPDSLRKAAAYSAARRGYSLLVSQRGRTVFESYSNGGSAGSAHKIYSGTKSFWAVATLVAEQEGLLDLDEPAAKTIGEWRNDSRKAITIRELLNFTSGLDPNFRLHSRSQTDRNSAALKTKVVAGRGKAFTYGPSHGQVLCEILRRKLAPRGETPSSFLRSRVIDPLGIGKFEYRDDSKGNPLVASGFKLTARKWAKFGHLLLGGGSHNGRAIVEQHRFNGMLRGTRANQAFGLCLWLNRGASSPAARDPDIEDMLEEPWHKQHWRGTCIAKDAPADLYAAVGSGYNRLYVIPSLDVVIVRQGQNAKFSDAEFLRLILRP